MKTIEANAKGTLTVVNQATGETKEVDHVIIALSGPRGIGKSYLAEVLYKKLYPACSLYSFANPLRNMFSQLCNSSDLEAVCKHRDQEALERVRKRGGGGPHPLEHLRYREFMLEAGNLVRRLTKNDRIFTDLVLHRMRSDYNNLTNPSLHRLIPNAPDVLVSVVEDVRSCDELYSLVGETVAGNCALLHLNLVNNDYGYTGAAYDESIEVQNTCCWSTITVGSKVASFRSDLHLYMQEVMNPRSNQELWLEGDGPLAQLRAALKKLRNRKNRENAKAKKGKL